MLYVMEGLDGGIIGVFDNDLDVLTTLHNHPEMEFDYDGAMKMAKDSGYRDLYAWTQDHSVFELDDMVKKGRIVDYQENIDYSAREIYYGKGPENIANALNESKRYNVSFDGLDDCVVDASTLEIAVAKAESKQNKAGAIWHSATKVVEAPEKVLKKSTKKAKNKGVCR